MVEYTDLSLILNEREGIMVTRYTVDWDCYSYPPCECSVEECKRGEYVTYDDYKKLEDLLNSVYKNSAPNLVRIVVDDNEDGDW